MFSAPKIPLWNARRRIGDNPGNLVGRKIRAAGASRFLWKSFSCLRGASDPMRRSIPQLWLFASLCLIAQVALGRRLASLPRPQPRRDDARDGRAADLERKGTCRLADRSAGLGQLESDRRWGQGAHRRGPGQGRGARALVLRPQRRARNSGSKSSTLPAPSRRTTRIPTPVQRRPATAAASSSGIVRPDCICYDLDGKELWRRDLGSFKHIWGYGSSPVIDGERIYLNAGPGKGSALCSHLELASGKTIWQVR